LKECKFHDNVIIGLDARSETASLLNDTSWRRHFLNLFLISKTRIINITLVSQLVI